MSLPLLPKVDVAALEKNVPPSPLIRTDDDVERWHRSRGFANYMLFLHRTSLAIEGSSLTDEDVLNDNTPVRSWCF